MRAVDTNVLVRFIVRDDEEQAEAARRLLSSSEKLLVSTTVLLEAEWVLRSGYKMRPAEIQRVLRLVVGLPVIVLEDERLARDALDTMSAGVDFADALHLGRTRQCEAFFTFDRELARRAPALWPIRIEAP